MKKEAPRISEIPDETAKLWSKDPVWLQRFHSAQRLDYEDDLGQRAHDLNEARPIHKKVLGIGVVNDEGLMREDADRDNAEFEERKKTS
jgi:hypothetical protein